MATAAHSSKHLIQTSFCLNLKFVQTSNVLSNVMHVRWSIWHLKWNIIITQQYLLINVNVGTAYPCCWLNILRVPSWPVGNILGTKWNKGHKSSRARNIFIFFLNTKFVSIFWLVLSEYLMHKLFIVFSWNKCTASSSRRSGVNFTS